MRINLINYKKAIMSEQLTKTFDKDKLLLMYENSDALGKKNLESIFGSDLFAPYTTELLEFVKTACKNQGLDFETDIPYKTPVNGHQKALNAMAMMLIGAKEIRGDWEPDWDNSSQAKYFPYYNMTSSGLGFSDTGYVCWVTFTSVGSRLCFPTKQQSDKFGKMFFPITKDFLTLK